MPPMGINRAAAIEYAKMYWNRACDDNKIWTTDKAIHVNAERTGMNAPIAEGWQVYFVKAGHGHEKAVFGRMVGGRWQFQRDSLDNDDLDDCTHYVSRCLLKEGIAIHETPRANELIEAMIKHPKAKVLALQTDRANGQKVVDSGIFKPGDIVGYHTKSKGRYTHSAMLAVTSADDPDDEGGITCHTVCRFRGLTQAWNTYDSDAWYLHEKPGYTYTLIHLTEDDTALTPDTSKRLPGWWKLDSSYYQILDSGMALATTKLPQEKDRDAWTAHFDARAFYFQGNHEVVFIWKKHHGRMQVERWALGADGNAKVKIDGFLKMATRV